MIIARMSKPDALEVLRSALTPEDDTLSERMQSLFQDRTALLARREALEESVIDGEFDTSTFARVEKKRAPRSLPRSTRNFRKSLKHSALIRWPLN